MQLRKQQIDALDDRYRARFINALSGFKNASLIATCDTSKNTNLALFTSVFHIGSKPALLGMISRPHSVPRHTLENILQTGHYSINHVNTSILQQSHQTSARYDATTSEFDATGLSEQWDDDFPCPFVEQSRIQMGMALREHHHLSINDTVMIIGEITHINIKDEVVGEDGYVDIEQAGSIVTSSLDCYHRSLRLSRLSYAKPDNPLEQITDSE